MTAGLLSGIVVLDLSSVGPASRCTQILADYGATVVKVGPVPGRGPKAPSLPWFAYGARRGMQHIGIDLSCAEGVDAFMTLAQGADVVVESFRPGVVTRLGIDYESIRARNKRVVYVSTSGYGQSGPRSSWAGHDLNYLAAGGFLASNVAPAVARGEASNASAEFPVLPGATIADAAAGGMQAALAVAAALVARGVGGEGTFLDVSVAEGVLWLMSLQIDEHLATGERVGPGHDVLSGRYACYGLYEAADAKWLAVAAIEPKFFVNLCNELGLAQWIDRQYDDDAQEDIRCALRAAFATAPRDQWVTLLASRDTCVTGVSDIQELVADPHWASREVFDDAVHESVGKFRQLGPVLAGMRRPSGSAIVRDNGASDVATLLSEAGVAPGRIEDWCDRGVVA